MRSVTVTPVLTEMVDDYWPLIKHDIESAVVRGCELGVSQIEVLLKRGILLALVVTDDSTDDLLGVVTVEKVGNRLHVWQVAGREVIRWKNVMVDFLDELARQTGKAFITGKGRRGWARLLRRRGFSYQEGELLCHSVAVQAKVAT